LIEKETRAIAICNQTDDLMKQQFWRKIKEMEEEDEESKMQDL
jgi:hypothetical protein